MSGRRTLLAVAAAAAIGATATAVCVGAQSVDVRPCQATRSGDVVMIDLRTCEVPPSTPPPTSTSTPASTPPDSSSSSAPTTFATSPAPTPSTSDPSTSVATTTTAPTPATTAAPTTALAAPTSSDFVATFSTPADFYDRFEGDVHFRANDYDRGASFHGDHDMSCAGPTTGRTVHVPPTDADQTLASEVFWYCAPGNDPAKGHVMTGMGAAGFGYSIVTFKPTRTFRDVERVCVDVNATDLGGDVWWEMSVLPAATFAANGGRMDYVTALARDIDDTALSFPDSAFVYQINDNKIRAWQGMGELVFDWYQWSTSDRAQRFEHCMVDNGDGTVTMTRHVGEITNDTPGGVRTVTVPGSFPNGDAVVLFQQSVYDPPKHGSGPTQTSLHWDDVEVN